MFINIFTVWGHQVRQYLPPPPPPLATYYIPKAEPISMNPVLYTDNTYKNDYFNPNNPWNNRFYGSSNLNNYNLPVAQPHPTGYFYIRPTYAM